MRTAITITKTHGGKWELVGTPDDSLLEQKKAFRALRSSKAHKEIAEVIYQENDGHRETIRLLTPKAFAKIEKQNAEDAAAVEEFDKQAAENPTVDPERAKIEAEFNAKEAAATAATGDPKPGEVVTEPETQPENH